MFYSLVSLLGVVMKTSVTSPKLRRATRSKTSTKRKKERTTVARNKKKNRRLEGKGFCRVMTMTMTTALMKILRTMTTKPATRNNRQRVRARQRRKAENLLARKWKCLMIMTWNLIFMQFSHQVTETG